MKNIFFSLLIAIGLVSCGGAPTPSGASSAVDSALVAQSIDKEQFLQKIYNYQTQGESAKFLGLKPAIVDFYASWCGPCRQLAPILDELLNQYGGKFDLYKVDVDNEQALAVDFGIESLPTLLFIPLEGEPKFIMGFQSKDKLEQHIKDILKID